MKVKRLTGNDGRRALYALAAATGELVLALGGDRGELRALAEAGAQRCGRKQLSAVAPVIVATQTPDQEVLD